MDSATIYDLPIEMIIEIFAYLNLSDLKEASLVCKDWYDAHHHPKTLDRMILALNYTNYEEYKTIMTERHFYNIMFHNVNFHKNPEDIKLWQDLGPNLQYLMFRSCTFTTSQLISILQTTQKLKTLKIEICNFVEPIKITPEFESVKDSLKNVTKLKFETLNENNVKLFDILMGMMPNLKSLETDNSSNRNNAKYIFDNIKKRSQTLQGLAMYSGSPSEFVERIINIENLHLKELNVTANLTPSLLKSLIIKQKSITDYFSIMSLNDDELITICNNLVNIKLFYMKTCHLYTDKGIQDLWKLKNLRFLQMNGCYSLTAKGLINGLKETNNNLRSLTLRLSESGENLLSHISNKFHNLRELEIKCGSGITDAEMQGIWKNLRWLRSFSFSGSEITLTDFAFTGMPTENDEANEESSIRCVKGLKHLDFDVDCDITEKTLNEIAKLNELISFTMNFKFEVAIDNLKILSNCKSMENIIIREPIEETSENQEALKKMFPRIKNCKFIKFRSDDYEDECYYDDDYDENDSSDNDFFM